MLALEEHTRELFARAVTAMKSGQGVADLHALDVSKPGAPLALGRGLEGASRVADLDWEGGRL